MKKINYLILLFTVLFAGVISAQTYTISGKVTSAATGEALVGANVYLQNTTTGAATDVDGKFSITTTAGEYKVICSFIGFEKKVFDINLTNNMELNFLLRDYAFSLNVEVIADRAREFETPVAFTNIDKKEIETSLGSRDIPLVLNTTPSVYATSGGGGAGDGRINVRGFNQRNIAVMINGVPINDIEWGWVYWSNWDGVGDAAGSIELQRGLSASTLNTPSIGGSMNLISEPTAQNFGVSLKQEFGTEGFLKSGLSFASGLMDGKWAINGNIVRKTGDGVVDQAWTDAWAYYLGAAYNVNDNNRIELYALGAPQRHGQRSYRLNIAAFSHEFAAGLKGTEDGWLEGAKFAEQGLKYNANWNKVDPSYNGKQYWNGSEGERFDPNVIMERENYYHKPQVNLNWYSKLSDVLSLYTTAYYSGGRGGGSGTFGSLQFNTSLYQRVPDWNKTIAINQAAGIITDRRNDPNYARSGILRNSVNSQDQFGAISKLVVKVNNNITAQVGVDWRTAEVYHYREVRDLLGATAFHWNGNQFESGDQYFKKLGDRIDYDFTNTVDWIGGFAQAEYSAEKVTAFASAGLNTKNYGYTNHMKKGSDGGELKAETDSFIGYQFKGGASYRLTKEFMFYANAGYVSSAPIFDNTINDVTGFVVQDPNNEIFQSVEGGFHYNKDNVSLGVTYYYTKWLDRASTETYRPTPDTEGMILISGMDQLHQGLEFDFSYQPVRELLLEVAASIGRWEFTNDVSAVYKDYSSGGANDVTFNAYVNGLKVGDSPQRSLSVTLGLFPIKGLSLFLTGQTYADHYAEWEPFDRSNQADAGIQPWKIPAYSVFDFHANYVLPVKLSGIGIEVFGHVFNLFDEEYVSDATDNSSFNAYGVKNHKADDAEVFFGLPRYFNAGIRLSY
ncbi:MAG: TonB-dependent receptor [Bacteroidetes bacterium]|nr:TonB-dependent receptor [Bacteroidota bacterium]